MCVCVHIYLCVGYGRCQPHISDSLREERVWRDAEGAIVERGRERDVHPLGASLVLHLFTTTEAGEGLASTNIPSLQSLLKLVNHPFDTPSIGIGHTIALLLHD